MGFQWQHFDFWRWVMHGWFLIVLFICACIDICLPNKIYRISFKRTFFILIVFTVLIYSLLLYLNGKYWHLDGFLFNFFILHTVQYYPFYFLGAWLYANKNLLNSVSFLLLVVLIFLAILTVGLDTLHGIQVINIESYFLILGSVVYRLVHLISAASVSFLLFYCFYHLRGQNSVWIRYLIQSAIVIYLIHHPIVIILAWLLDFEIISNLTYYFLNVIFTFCLSFAAYEIIRRVSWLRFAFGLSPVKK